MIDIHAHILPGIDDGAETIDDSLLMIRQAIDAGVSVICATPHVLGDVSGSLRERINRTFRLVVSRVEREELKVKLLLGSEIYVRQDICLLSRFDFFSLNRTGKYVLVELPLGQVPPNIDRPFRNLLLDGVTPIIAHPERSITDESQFEAIQSLIQLGALTQINAGSLLGRFGRAPRKAAQRLLEKELVHVMASDAHDPGARSIALLRKSYTEVCRLAGKTKADELTIQSPWQILNGERMLTTRPQKVTEKEVGQLLDN
jgi:protein-tyrosine phosphatase